MARARATFGIALIMAACVFMLAAQSEAFFFGGPLEQVFRNYVGCLESLGRIGSGCANQARNSFLTSQLDLIETHCCRSFLVADDNCWSFPLNPFFPPLFKNHCQEEVED